MLREDSSLLRLLAQRRLTLLRIRAQRRLSLLRMHAQRRLSLLRIRAQRRLSLIRILAKRRLSLLRIHAQMTIFTKDTCSVRCRNLLLFFDLWVQCQKIGKFCNECVLRTHVKVFIFKNYRNLKINIFLKHFILGPKIGKMVFDWDKAKIKKLVFSLHILLLNKPRNTFCFKCNH